MNNRFEEANNQIRAIVDELNTGDHADIFRDIVDGTIIAQNINNNTTGNDVENSIARSLYNSGWSEDPDEDWKITLLKIKARPIIQTLTPHINRDINIKRIVTNINNWVINHSNESDNNGTNGTLPYPSQGGKSKMAHKSKKYKKSKKSKKNKTKRRKH